MKVISCNPSNPFSLCKESMCVPFCVRSGSAAHSRFDPVASVWVVGIPPPVFAGKTRGEYLAVCLSPPSPALVDRRTHTSRPLWSDFPTRTHTCTHTHTLDTHTCRAPSIHPRLSLPGCLHPATQLEMTHTRAHTHTHMNTCTRSYAHSRVIHASFQITVLIKCSHTQSES